MAYIQGLVDKEGNSIYPPTVASAVYVQTKSGTTTSQQKLSDKLSDIDSTVTDMKTSFQDGVDTLVNKLKELGITPSENSPSGIAVAIQTLSETYYNIGYTAANETVTTTSASYTAGVTQGHNDVIASPGDYGLITESDLETYGTEKYNSGYAAGKKAVNGSVSCSAGWSRTNAGDIGVKVSISNSATATATIVDGKLSVSISGNGSGTGWRYIAGEGNDGWTDQTSTSASGSGSNSKQIA
jgi:hypothetical protein